MYELKVTGMTCGSCAGSMTYALRAVDPDVELKVDIKTQTVTVKSHLEKERIISVIEETGFPVLQSKPLGSISERKK